MGGRWAEAREGFLQIESVKGMADYPSKNILSIMGEHNFKAPSDWEGYRVLTEK